MVSSSVLYRPLTAPRSLSENVSPLHVKLLNQLAMFGISGLNGIVRFAVVLVMAASIFHPDSIAAQNLANGGGQKGFDVEDDGEAVTIATENYQIHIKKEGFRYRIQDADGAVMAPAHPESGLMIGKSAAPSKPLEKATSPVAKTTLKDTSGSGVGFTVQTKEGLKAEVRVRPEQRMARLSVRPREDGQYAIAVRTGGVSPSYGLADHAAFGSGSWDSGVRSKTELTGFEMDPLRQYRLQYRMISNFVVFPRQGFAEVNIEPSDKAVRLTQRENLQASKGVRSMPSMYYFVGSPEQIYSRFLEVRNQQGYPFHKPKYAMFGVGWEAFGALSWRTRQETILKNVETYLNEGYPLKWMVVGSGFWPRAEGQFDEHGSPIETEESSADEKKLRATTSFGMWDDKLYPTPRELVNHFHDRGLKFLIGLRIGFIPGGPYTDQGLEEGYFLTVDGEPKLYDVGFPKPSVYLLNTRDPEAVEWYVNLSEQWLKSGVDGFKEDLYDWPQSLPDDLVNPVNQEMRERGIYLIGRNNYLGSPADLHRINDYNYNQPQDRGPINGLAFAYSGFPYVYPDIVGGTGLATKKYGDISKEKMGDYLMRFAQYASVNPSMSFGYGPWKLEDERVNDVAVESAKLHNRLLPYIYDAALKTHETGFPYTMTPLPLAYPDDPEVYGLANTERRAYEWLIGESLLATPLYGADYDTATTRDLYLPEGTWVQYETGKVYEGPTTLEDFPLPIGKTPLFVGGKGIIVEKRDGALEAWVYPIQNEVSYTFDHKDGWVSTISVEVSNWEGANIRVIDQTRDEKVSVRKMRGAVGFTIEAGHDYRVRPQK